MEFHLIGAVLCLFFHLKYKPLSFSAVVLRSMTHKVSLNQEVSNFHHSQLSTLYGMHTTRSACLNICPCLFLNQYFC